MPHILLVDDDPVQSSVYARLLAARGYTAAVAADAGAGLVSYGRRRPDAIVADLGLPRGGVMDLIRTVRREPDGAEVCIVVLGNAFLETEAQAALDAGADEVAARGTHSPGRVLSLVAERIGDSAAAGPPPPDPALAAFARHATEYLAECRAALAFLAEHGASPEPLDALTTRLRHLQAAQSYGAGDVAQAAAAAEWLARALVAWPSSIGPSTLRTLRQAVRLMEIRLADRSLPVRDAAGFRALGVDDDPTSRLLLKQAFRKIQIPCDLVDDGEAGLAAAQAQRYDLVVSDVLMVRMDGFEMVARLRRIAGYATTPVIYVTSLEGFDGAAARETGGGSDAIVKPYLIMELATKAVVHLLAPRA